MAVSTPIMRLCLDELLEKQQISRYELAKRTGVTYPTIDGYYKNKVLRYDTEVLLKICVALNCEISELIKITHAT
ncbi:MAG: helix-turn-helix transcriptional regulator [Clostridiales bacterium]|nr:helix-turn-helix transcriptional regulator [Clostridiales bacterium]